MTPLPLTLAIFIFLNLVSAVPAPAKNTAVSSPAAETEECNLENLKQIIFNSTLDSFLELFKSQTRPTCYHWCTNGCSKSPDSYPYNLEGDKISWKPVCARHDFSWHNLKRYGAFNEETKLNSDEHLRDGMVELCGEHKVCKEIAEKVYFTAVRNVQEPATEYNSWDAKKQTDCTIFPGCCTNHSNPSTCGSENLIGGFKGDLSCVAK